MPFYIFLNEKTGEVKEVFFHMNDTKRFIDNSGYEWTRQLSIPNTAIDTKIDPFSSKDFANKTAKGGKMGDILDRSKELSEKRKNKLGFDPIQEKYYSDYSKIRNGKEHQDVKKRKLKETLKNNPLFKLS